MRRRNKRKTKKTVLQNVEQNYKLCGTSLSVQTKTFFENSTLHGVRYIAEKGRPFIEKFMWFACVVTGAVATTIIIINLWEKFQTNPTITGLDTDFHNWDVPFPAITICPEKPSNDTRLEEVIEKYNVDEKFLQDLTELSYETIFKFVSNNKEYLDKISEGNNEEVALKKIKIKQLVFEAMNTCEDIFEACVWKSNNYNCCEGFFPVFTENGFCFTFNSRHFENKNPGSNDLLTDKPFEMQYIKETDAAWSYKFRVQSDEINMPIYILNSDEIAGIDLEPQHIWDFNVMTISFSVKQTYTTSDTRQLSIKQRHCVFQDEVKLKNDHMYTYTACTRQCRMNTATKKCGCVPHFYPEVEGFYKHCSLTELECIAVNLQEIKSVDHCSCHLSCDNTVYEVEKLNENAAAEFKTELETRFVSWPMVRYKREVLFGWVDLLVSFGGIAGLFLGFSLLSGVEIIYFFTVRALCMTLREREELEKIQYEEASKPPPDYDLSLIPYFLSQPMPGNGINEVAKGFYKENLQNYNKKVGPINGAATIWKPKDTMLPPFDIEFTN